MKTLVKQVVPAPMRLQMRVWQRQWADRLAGKSLVLPPVLSPKQQAQFLPRLCLTQALLPTHYSENKRHNLALAMQQLQHRAIAPGQVFSFWRWVGQPNHAKGYREGRSLVGDVLRAEVGGGLCQLSGLIYFLALRAGLQIVERHAHSRDIYTDATRFTPLGRMQRWSTAIKIYVFAIPYLPQFAFSLTSPMPWSRQPCVRQCPFRSARSSF
jgi:vancomycin resistance protein VanW